MDFAFSQEQDLLRKSAQQFLAERHPLEQVPEVVDAEPGWQPGTWPELTRLGWLDDLGLLEHVVLLEETGAALLPVPLFSTLALALPAVAHDAGLRGKVAAGDLRLTLAWAEYGRPQGLTDAEGCRTTVDAEGRVTGRKVLVPDATLVDAFVVAARGDDGVELRLVEAPDATIVPRSTSDRSRRMAEVEFAGAPSVPLAGPDGVAAVLARTERRALVLVAAEALGAGRRALDLAVSYAGAREQFGKPIGTYQGVSHRLADSYAALELARSLTYWAAWAVGSADEPGDSQAALPDAGGPRGDGQAGAACAAAKAAATEAAVLSCENAIQVTGGLGMTWEHLLHRLYKRAQWLQSFAAGSRELHARIADTLL